MQGLGYKEVVAYFNNEYSKEEMIEKIKMESRRYAKRQLTWFRRNKSIKWLDASNGTIKNTEIILEEIRWRNYRKEKFKKQKDIESSVYNYSSYSMYIFNCTTYKINKKTDRNICSWKRENLSGGVCVRLYN